MFLISTYYCLKNCRKLHLVLVSSTFLLPLRNHHRMNKKKISIISLALQTLTLNNKKNLQAEKISSLSIIISKFLAKDMTEEIFYLFIFLSTMRFYCLFLLWKKKSQNSIKWNERSFISSSHINIFSLYFLIVSLFFTNRK